jgi:hypothetical protein
MKIFKITLMDAELMDKEPVLYFEEQKTAEMVMRAFNAILGEGNSFHWKCEIIHTRSHEEAVKEFTPGAMALLAKHRSTLGKDNILKN